MLARCGQNVQLFSRHATNLSSLRVIPGRDGAALGKHWSEAAPPARNVRRGAQQV